ncbi:MAG: hypothetical protein J6386_19565 [Candidatus Synoicihabitans palmerolidicus]|nr:hypothetical protein [Candidatus Synoicihabitans palmerolidicus]
MKATTGVRTLAFLFPPEPARSAELSDYLTTIDEIEYRTGLDFLAALPDPADPAETAAKTAKTAKTALEAQPASRVWQTGPH